MSEANSIGAKPCTKCGEVKTLENYGLKVSNKKDRRAECNECRKKYRVQNRQQISVKTNAWRKAHWEQYLEKSRLRRRSKTKEQRHDEYMRSVEKHGRKKLNARRSVAYHVGKGNLKRLPCQVCGSQRSQAHHEDYDRRLDVIWLCAQCHADRHRKKAEARRAAS